jgi:hypothetical protein
MSHPALRAHPFNFHFCPSQTKNMNSGADIEKQSAELCKYCRTLFPPKVSQTKLSFHETVVDLKASSPHCTICKVIAEFCTIESARKLFPAFEEAIYDRSFLEVKFSEMQVSELGVAWALLEVIVDNRWVDCRLRSTFSITSVLPIRTSCSKDSLCSSIFGSR